MSALGSARAAMVAALTAGGVRVPSGLRVSAPCVMVEPGDPWTEPSRLPGRLSRWKLTAIAAAVDSDASIAELAELVDAVDTALYGLQGVQLPTWSKPADIQLEGVLRPATTAIVSIPADIASGG